MKRITGTTPDLTQQNVEKLAEVFPVVVSEIVGDDGTPVRVVDYDLLKQLLSDSLVEGGEERYRLDWPGKKASLIKANSPIEKVLRPDHEASVDFDTTQNVFIEGDNFEALKILQESYLGKVKVIYIDPPYNTGRDFVYSDTFTQDKREYEEEIDAVDEEGNKMFRENTKTNPRFHSDWLSMMYERLIIARDLLKDDGVVFISIDDNEVHNLRKICDEIFGEDNFVGTLIHQRAKGGGMAKNFVNSHDYIHVYARNIEKIDLKQKKIVQQKVVQIEGVDYAINDDLYRRNFGGRIDKTAPHRCYFYEELEEAKGIEEKNRVDEKIAEGSYFLKKHASGNHLVARYEKISDLYSKVYGIIKILSEEGKKETDSLIGEDIFSYPKPTALLKFLIEISTQGSNTSGTDIVLDFFSGSGTAAHAVMQQNAEDGGNRKFMLVQLPEETPEGSEAHKQGYTTIAEIGRERIRRAAEQVRTEYADALAEREIAFDTGFRAYRVDSSSFEDVARHPADLTQDMLPQLAENIKSDRTPSDLLTHVMLDLGLTLDLPIETIVIGKNTIFSVSGSSLVACFDEQVPLSIIDEIAARKPAQAVFRDSSFGNDDNLINAETHLKRLSPDTVLSVM